MFRAVCLVLLLFTGLASAQDFPKDFVGPIVPDAPAKDLMPISRLGQAKLIPDLCLYRYPVSSGSPECRKFCDQALGYYYSYVWMEAARSFETALQHDPKCAFAWLGLHRSLEKWGSSNKPQDGKPLGTVLGAMFLAKPTDAYAKPPKEFALEQAKATMKQASHRERLLIQAKLQERGMWPDTKSEDRKKKAAETLNELLTLEEDDEEAWFARAQLAEGSNAAVPYYKALLKINPLHPGANHELVHHYEGIHRPALGWIHAERYMESSPGMPHAFHMQAHLATRVGKWANTTNWSYRAFSMQKEYHRIQDVKPADDHQFQHHTEILIRSLLHDGRLSEARSLKAEADSYGFKFPELWFRLSMLGGTVADAEALVQTVRKKDKAQAAYLAAMLALQQGSTGKAQAEIDVLQQALRTKKDNRGLQQKYLEVQAWLQCQCGQGDEGLKLFKKLIDQTKNDFGHHAWGGGATYMEVWGVAALQAGKPVEAEEAFQEALAHDAGSVQGALGLWATCTSIGRSDEAARYMKLAQKCWAKADPADFERLKNHMRQLVRTEPATR